jgi:DNA-binding NtrC family response regulator
LPAGLLDAVLNTSAGATIYLQALSSSPLDVQSRLHQLLLEEKDRPRLRLIWSCGSDLQADLRAGRLRPELYAFASTLQIELPPLRERLDDLPVLVEHMFERLNADRESPINGLSVDAWNLLRSYNWPGNLRELYDALGSASRRAAGDHLESFHFPRKVRLAGRAGQEAEPETAKPIPLDKLLEEAERRLIVLALRRCRGNRSQAAELLSIWRPRLLRRMEALGITESGAGGASNPPGPEQGAEN